KPFETNINLIYKKIDGLEYKNNTSKIVDNIETIINNESNFSINCKESNIKLKVTDLENNIYFDDIVNMNSIYMPHNDGEYIYNFNVKWDNESYGSMSILYKITIDNPIEFSVNKTEVMQGDFITIKAFNVNDDEVLYLENPFFDRFRFFKEGAFQIGYLPISSRIVPKEYIIKYGVIDKYLENIEIKVKKRNFRIQNLYVEKSIMKTTSNNSAYEEYYKYFYPARDIVDENKNYSNQFILPVTGKVTTEFGEYRYINDRVTSYSHSGIDIAAEKGTKVKTTNSGYVTLSKNLVLTGNTIIIDHGQGMFSFYQHLDERFVKTDQFVENGEYIGTVGTTGRSTGPHLHFAISFHNKYIDPGYLIYNEPITKDNYIELFNEN
ncbi:M23 family metallopeptidase, partial [Clostridiaceae bacterium HSG29]|nr:M23 family metallopeptidase [Clostridiaceae bacterium HSG29]